ncbi:hypothetical protein BMS3Abin13_01864 [bacterium BMS3Abin13]|nr:hypothetical protein BMS3Abin13_01864 [bacterium BMS3Abin13]
MQPGRGRFEQGVHHQEAGLVRDQVMQVVEDKVEIVLQEGVEIVQQQINSFLQTEQDEITLPRNLCGCG